MLADLKEPGGESWDNGGPSLPHIPVPGELLGLFEPAAVIFIRKNVALKSLPIAGNMLTRGGINVRLWPELETLSSADTGPMPTSLPDLRVKLGLVAGCCRRGGPEASF